MLLGSFTEVGDHPISDMTKQTLRSRLVEAMQTASATGGERDWWDVAADGAMAAMAKAFRDAELGLSADWIEHHRKVEPMPLWIEMERAFDSQIDDCFYEFNEAAAAMLKAVADRLQSQTYLEAANYVRAQADIADKYTD